MTSNLKARLLFIKPHVPYKISKRTWLNIYNRSGDRCLYKAKRRKKVYLKAVMSQPVDAFNVGENELSIGYQIELGVKK